MQNQQQSSNRHPTYYNAFYGPNYVIGPNNMGFVGSSSDALHNAPSSNQGHNIMFDPSSSSNLQYSALIDPPAAGQMQHNTTYALLSSSSMQHAAHQGQTMHGIPNAAGAPPASRQPVAQRGPSREQLERFLMRAPIEQLRRRLWESFHGLSERNKEHRTLQASFQASKKRREELELENSELRQQLNAKTQEYKNIQTFMNNDFFHTMQAELEPRLEGLNTELSNSGMALNAKTQECEQLRWSNAVEAGLAQPAMPPRMSDREVVESFAPMNRADVHEPLPLTLPDTQRDGQPTGLIYPALQPSPYENYGYTRASNEGLQDMTLAGNTDSPPLIDLTEEKPEALEQDSGATTNHSGDGGSTLTFTSSHRLSDASATTFNSSEQSASASSSQVDSCDPANVGNQLKRGAGTDLVGAVKKPRRSDYSWLQGTGNPAKANDDWTKVRGGVPQDGRSSYLFNQDNEWEKRKKKYEIRCKKDGIDPKKRSFEAVEQKPSVQRAKAAAQRSEAKKRVPKAKAPRPASSAVSTGTPQIDTVEHPVAEASVTIQVRDQQSSKSQTVISDEDDDMDTYAVELEAELARESEVHIDEATAGQAPDEDEDMDGYAAELEAELERESEDKVDEAIVEQLTDADEPIPDGFFPCDETDQDSLFGGDMDDRSADDEPKPKDPREPPIYERPAGPALYHQWLTFIFGDGDLAKDQELRRSLVNSHNYTFTEQDLKENRTLMLIVARAHGNAWAEVEGKALEDVFHNETSTAGAPMEKRDSPPRSRHGKGRVEEGAEGKGGCKEASPAMKEAQGREQGGRERGGREQVGKE